MKVAEFARFFDDAFAGSPIIGLFRGLSVELAVEQCLAAWDAGIRVVEIPLMGPSDHRALKGALAAARGTGGIVGAGTITSAEALRVAAAAGAAFTVSPGSSTDVLDLSEQLGIPHLPGASTATELTALSQRGYRWIKAFPASVLTPQWMTAMRGPFPKLVFVATGGVTPETAGDFLEAGCGAVALGSALTEPGAIARLRPLLGSTAEAAEEPDGS